MSALEAAEKLRDIQIDGEVRARVFSPFGEVYRNLLHYLLHSRDDPLPAALSDNSDNDWERAFLVSEKMRARALLDELDAAGATPLLVASHPLAGQREGILSEIAQRQRRLLSGRLTTTQRNQVLTEIETLEIEAAELTDSMARQDSSFSHLRRPEFPTTQEVREKLSESEAILSFIIRRNQESLVLVLTRESIDFHRIPSAVELQHPLQLFLGLIERRDGSSRRGAVRLYRELLDGALSHLPARVQHLIIVPDGLLFRLPFGALRLSTHRTLSESYRISMVPSVTLWMRWRQLLHPPAGGAVLVLADPSLPRPGSLQSLNGERQTERSPDNPGRFEPLPHARREGAAISRHLGAHATLLTGDQATEFFLKTRDLGPYGVIHLAAHGVLDDQRPDRTALLLAPGHPKEDGLLQIREIVTLDLAGKVVVLSACRSASGDLVGGEGVIGLARALLQAGARAVVGNLWAVRDDDSRVFFDRFYRYMSEGEKLSRALTRAQQDLIRIDAPVAAWAGVVLIGDGEFVPFPGRRAEPFPWVLSLGLAALGISISTVLWITFRRRFWRGPSVPREDRSSARG